MLENYKSSRRIQLFESQHGRCYYCDTRLAMDNKYALIPEYATIDHIMPLSKGGSNRVDNKVLACRQCNTVKGSFVGTLDEIRNYIKDYHTHEAMKQEERRKRKYGNLV